jgi:hypothetical protein
MTRKQYNLAFEAQEEFKKLYPEAKVVVTFNHYTKLPEFMVLLNNGGWSFSMHRREEYVTKTNDWGVTWNQPTGNKYVELSATFDPTTKDSGNGMIVSGAHNVFELPKSSFIEKLPRVNFDKYIEFTKQVLGKVMEPAAV